MLKRPASGAIWLVDVFTMRMPTMRSSLQIGQVQTCFMKDLQDPGAIS